MTTMVIIKAIATYIIAINRGTRWNMWKLLSLDCSLQIDNFRGLAAARPGSAISRCSWHWTRRGLVFQIFQVFGVLQMPSRAAVIVVVAVRGLGGKQLAADVAVFQRAAIAVEMLVVAVQTRLFRWRDDGGVIFSMNAVAIFHQRRRPNTQVFSSCSCC